MRKMIGALAIAALIGAVLVFLNPAPETPAATPVNPPDAPAVDPAPYRAAFPLTTPAIHDDGATPAAVALRRALAPFRKGDYAAAARELEGVWTDHPAEHRAALYLGISRLFLDEVPSAIEVLQVAQGSPDPLVRADAQWYAIVGIARLRDPREAQPMAKALCEAGAAGSERACRAVNALQ